MQLIMNFFRACEIWHGYCPSLHGTEAGETQVIDRELDLVGAIQPLGLLKVAERLTRMDRGEVLSVIVPDSEFLENILVIINRSPNRILDYGETGPHYRVLIKKGDTASSRIEKEDHG